MQSPAVGPVPPPPQAGRVLSPPRAPCSRQPVGRVRARGRGALQRRVRGRRPAGGKRPCARTPQARGLGAGWLTPSGAFPEAGPPRFPRSPGRSRRRPRDPPRRGRRPRNSSGCGSARGLSEGKAGTGGRQLAGRGAARLRRMLSSCPARPRAHDGHPGAQSLSPRGKSCAAIRRGPRSARPWSARLPRPQLPLPTPRPCSPRVPCTPSPAPPGPLPVRPCWFRART